jgi:hypothetical protein
MMMVAIYVHFIHIFRFTHSLRSFVKYCFHHSKIKVISSRRRVISSIYETRVASKNIIDITGCQRTNFKYMPNF